MYWACAWASTQPPPQHPSLQLFFRKTGEGNQLPWDAVRTEVVCTELCKLRLDFNIWGLETCMRSPHGPESLGGSELMKEASRVETGPGHYAPQGCRQKVEGP
jgi:hypothetical protein